MCAPSPFLSHGSLSTPNAVKEPYDHLCTASIPKTPKKNVAPSPPTPKEAGIGMKIGEQCHEVTGFVKGGAAAECGLISQGDKLFQVDGNDVTNVSTEECSKLIIGPEDSEIKLQFSRPPRLKREGKKNAPKMVGVGLLLDSKKMKNGQRVHLVGGVAADGAAAESGRIAVNDQLLAVNGTCSLY